MQTQLLRRAAARRRRDAGAAVDAVLHDIEQVESVVRGSDRARPARRTATRQPTPLNDVIDDVLRPARRSQLTYRKIAVDADLDRSAAVDRSLDATAFRQALLNVHRRTPPTRCPPAARCSVVDAPGDDGSTVVLDVCDDGIGIDPAIRDRVFDPFVSTKRDGVGLGLVNAKAVVESHGGTIELLRRAAARARARP